MRTNCMLCFVCLFGLISIMPARTALAGGPDVLKLENTELHLNGSGYRKKGLFTLYEGALYLQQPSRDAQAIIGADAPMAIRIQITSGFVSQQKMLDALQQGFQNATGGNTNRIASQIQQFQQCFSDPINKDDVFVLSNIPGSGVLVVKNGTQKGRISGVEFKQALFGIWLSDRPADNGLKRAMLGN